jgi:hypothetical protein
MSNELKKRSLSGDAGDGSKKFYFLNTATPSPAASRSKERRYQTMGQEEEKLEAGQVNAGQGQDKIQQMQMI